MYDFGNANDEQNKAIKATNGPVLIIAGPGTGKTKTLIDRAVYLVKEEKAKPENIMMATFTEKAAKELIKRITEKLASNSIAYNLNEMYIGTIHSICLRILQDYPEYSKLPKNYRVLDQFDQYYTVYRAYERFEKIDGFKEAVLIADYEERKDPKWAKSVEICRLANSISEELIDPAVLIADQDSAVIRTLGLICREYQALLNEKCLLDFTALQTKTYRLLKEKPDILRELQAKITHIMIDEYQDTNHIQEKLVFLLGGDKKNICVVGDDDQALYRFRGATIRNILEFSKRIGGCETVYLTKNYRSRQGIIDLYNKWMANPVDFKWADGHGNKFRHGKEIVATRDAIYSPTAVKLSDYNDKQWLDWQTKLLDFIKNAKASGAITDFNQIVYLSNSVRTKTTKNLIKFLESNGVPVYSPRSNMYFEREEVKLIIGCLLLLFPNYVAELAKNTYDFGAYLRDCIAKAESLLAQVENEGFRKWVESRGQIHMKLTENTNYTYLDLVYRMFAFPPFADILAIDMNETDGVKDTRNTRNLALFTRIVAGFEYTNNIQVLSPEHIMSNTKSLFEFYLRLRYQSHTEEYEDNAEYAPKGCMSFMTVHQAKGLEFPMVLVGVFSWTRPSEPKTDILMEVEKKYYTRKSFEPHEEIKTFEPYEDIKTFDFWRLYYTAFSRAQELLVLTCRESTGNDKPYLDAPQKCLKWLYDDLPEIGTAPDLSEFDFLSVDKTELKESFAFTSHISFYNNCPQQYKFYKELGFASGQRNWGIFFGVTVHQTIEDIHRAILRGERDMIDEECISDWFDINYQTMCISEGANPGDKQKKQIFDQILRYARNHSQHWDDLQEVEANVSLVEKKYIITGAVDLIRGEGGTRELMDFKTGKKPAADDKTGLRDKYCQQMQIYAHLINERDAQLIEQGEVQPVSKAKLYFTGDKSDNPILSFDCDEAAVKGAMATFDATVQKIMAKNFASSTDNKEICNDCDFRHFCKAVS